MTMTRPLTREKQRKLRALDRLKSVSEAWKASVVDIDRDALSMLRHFFFMREKQ